MCARAIIGACENLLYVEVLLNLPLWLLALRITVTSDKLDFT